MSRGAFLFTTIVLAFLFFAFVFQNCSVTPEECSQSNLENLLNQKNYQEIIAIMNKETSSCTIQPETQKMLGYAYAGKAGFSTPEIIRLANDVISVQKSIKKQIEYTGSSNIVFSDYAVFLKISAILPNGNLENVETIKKSIKILEDVYGDKQEDRSSRANLEIAGLRIYLAAIEFSIIIKDSFSVITQAHVGSLSNKEKVILVVKFLKSDVYITLNLIRDIYLALLAAENSYPTLKEIGDQLIMFYKKTFKEEFLVNLGSKEIGDYLDESTNILKCVEDSFNAMPENDFNPESNPSGYIPPLPEQAKGTICQGQVQSFIEFIYKNE